MAEIKQVCKHFFLPSKILYRKKYTKAHNEEGNKYKFIDVIEVERVYCCKCGIDCWKDLSNLKNNSVKE